MTNGQAIEIMEFRRDMAAVGSDLRIAINKAIEALEWQRRMVHCKECIHWVSANNPVPSMAWQMCCRLCGGEIRFEDDYCSKGVTETMDADEVEDGR